jgi:3-methyl-2-oxobutanoate hydroxymethyltransferase
MAQSDPIKKQTTVSLQSLKKARGGRRLIATTAYDYTFARLVDEAADIVLVGDSLGMVIQGQPNTLTVTVDDIVYHCRAVSRALSHAHLCADMPFMSYQTGVKSAIRNAGRLISEGHAESVKLEGGVSIARTVEKMVQFGIPVIGHVGLTPQSIHVFGGFKMQGKTERARNSILEDARALEDAGAYAVLLEGIPQDLAREITEALSVPTIGIGAGPHCDGQILVIQDLLGLNTEYLPRFVKQFGNFADSIKGAVQKFADEVQSGAFPDDKHSF